MGESDATAVVNQNKRRIKGFLNIYSNNSVGGWFSGKQDADEMALSGRVACLNLEDYEIYYTPEAKP